ncbi:MAG: hypothetical protein Q8P51_04175 [Ignavibacteria bacterium]|nr:hypothetical protein [Ignavibacteria bacterium]
MRSTTLVLLFLASFTIALSHPGVGINMVARRLAERTPSSDRHAVMGLWADTEGNAYAAVAANRTVKRVAPDGSVVVVAQSKSLWAPSGGLTAPNGAMWILEYSVINAVRVRRIDRSGQSTVFE